jgi:ABC-type multidrug transport system ATPase subunit
VKRNNENKDIAIRVEQISKVFPSEFKFKEWIKSPFTYKKSKPKIGLMESSFEIRSGTLTAIMGPSGCGKSTLLKILLGELESNNNGQIFIDGAELNTENYGYLRTKIGYVAQEDSSNLFMNLSVRSSLLYTAKLRMPDKSNKFLEQRVNDVLKKLNIQKIKDNLIKNTSGGQKKRIAIASEILNEPQLLFLDEPTSPLDPQTIEEFLTILKELTNDGTTVLMVTHKPEDLFFMDDVIFMAEGGSIVYHGDKDGFLKYFKCKHVVEVYAKTVGENIKEWVQKFDKTNISNKNEKIEVGKELKWERPKYWLQYFTLTSRYLKIKTNDKQNLLFLLGQAPIIALLIAWIFNEISQVVPFFLAISAIWFGTNNAAREIVSEKDIFKRERMFNLGLFPYIFSKLSVLVYIAFIQSILFVTILYFRYADDSNTVHLQNPVLCVAWMTIVSGASSLMGLLLSALVSSAERVMTILPLLLLPQIMLAGIIVKIPHLAMELLSYFTLSRWSTLGFAKVQENISVPKYLPDPSCQICFRSNEEIKQNAYTAISESFYHDFHDFWSNFRNSISVETFIITGISFILFWGLYFSLKDKDSIEIID